MPVVCEVRIVRLKLPETTSGKSRNPDPGQRKMHQRNLPKWYNRLAWGFKNPSNP